MDPTASPASTDPELPRLEQRLRVRALRVSWVKDLVQAIGFTAAGLWAIYTFWYRETYLPRRTDANVGVRVQLEVLGEKDGVVAVRARTLLDNPGKARARILASELIAEGLRLRPAPTTPSSPPAVGGALPAGSFVVQDRTLPSTPELVFHDLDVEERFDGDIRAWINPDGHLERERVLFVPKGEFAVFRVQSLVTWLPEAYPLRKDCYTLLRTPDGVMQVSNRLGKGEGCRLTSAQGSASVTLW